MGREWWGSRGGCVGVVGVQGWVGRGWWESSGWVCRGGGGPVGGFVGAGGGPMVADRGGGGLGVGG